jgi:hypothetical protein
VYLPLADGPLTLWAIPRSQDPSAVLPSDQLTLSVRPTAPAKAIGLPQSTIEIDFTRVESTTLYAHLRPFDALYAWDGYASVSARRGALMAQAEADWNVDVLKWHTLPTTEPESASYAPAYGFIRESAGRHGFAPEFLHTVAFGEGMNRTFENGIEANRDFDPHEEIDAFDAFGLDLILYRVGWRDADGNPPPLPPELPPDADEERAEYTFDLVAEGYVDAATAAAVLPGEVFERTDVVTRTIQLARIQGWAAAIELLAAELHARLDEMVAHLAGKDPPVPVVDESQRRYLAYVRFNTRFETARTHADNLSARLQRWPGERPGHNRNAEYNTIQRIAVTQWHEAAGIYR